MNAGKYNVPLDADNPAGGIYFYKLTSGNFTKTKEWFSEINNTLLLLTKAPG
jgi:hypothetical protein